MRVHYEHNNAVELISDNILSLLVGVKENISIVCIGTDGCVGDSLGPLVGFFLKQQGIEVYGDIDNPIHAKNIKKRISNIPEDNFIIAVDSCVGEVYNIGIVDVKAEGVRPGSGMDKNIKKVGNMSIGGTVSYYASAKQVFNNLRNVRISLVVNMAKLISDSIMKALKQHKLNNMLKVQITA